MLPLTFKLGEIQPLRTLDFRRKLEETGYLAGSDLQGAAPADQQSAASPTNGQPKTSEDKARQGGQGGEFPGPRPSRGDHRTTLTLLTVSQQCKIGRRACIDSRGSTKNLRRHRILDWLRFSPRDKFLATPWRPTYRWPCGYVPSSPLRLGARAS